MAKESKVDKKDKKRKEPEQDVEDVEMGDVAPEVRMCHIQSPSATLILVPHLVPVEEVKEGKGRGHCFTRGYVPHRPPISSKETSEEASQDYQEGHVLVMSHRQFGRLQSCSLSFESAPSEARSEGSRQGYS